MSAPEPPLTLKEVRRLADTTWVSALGLYTQDRSVALSTRPCETVRRLCATVEQYAEDAARREAAEAEELRLLREWEAAARKLDFAFEEWTAGRSDYAEVMLARLNRNAAWENLGQFRDRESIP